MRRSQQAFSVPSKQTQSSNAKDDLSSTASINASSTTLIPSSKLLASKPRDCTLKREQNSCYEHDNGLNKEINAAFADPATRGRFNELGGAMLPGSPADFGKLVAEDTEKWGRVMKFANIKPE